MYNLRNSGRIFEEIAKRTIREISKGNLGRTPKKMFGRTSGQILEQNVCRYPCMNS